MRIILKKDENILMFVNICIHNENNVIFVL